MAIKHIIQGFTNLVKDNFGMLSEEIKEVASMRHNHCASCTLRDGNTCSTKTTAFHVKTGELTKGCGCNLAAKVVSPSSSCPLGKWEAIANEWILMGKTEEGFEFVKAGVNLDDVHTVRTVNGTDDLKLATKIANNGGKY